MIYKALLALTMVVATLAPAAAAEPIVGNWKTASGETAAIAACGPDFCVTLTTGKHAGRKITQSCNRYTQRHALFSTREGPCPCHPRPSHRAFNE